VLLSQVVRFGRRPNDSGCRLAAGTV
jgi:hypothetical protein